MTTLQCDQCGAAARAGDDQFCSYCGAKYQVPEPALPPREGARRETAERFERLAEDPRARAAMRSRVSGARAVAKQGAGALFAILFVVIAGIVAMSFIGVAGEVERGFDGFGPAGPGAGFSPLDPGPGIPALFKIIPLFVVGAGIYLATRETRKTARVAGSRTVARLAHVLDEHTETRGTTSRRVRTVHVVTLENESGRRNSHEVSSRLARRLAPGDMGVAHTKGGELLRFTRVDV